MSRREMMKQLKQNLACLKTVTAHCHKIIEQSNQEEMMPALHQINTYLKAVNSQTATIRLLRQMQKGGK
jgi:glycerol-3-phosphate O-acyltransferase